MKYVTWRTFWPMMVFWPLALLMAWANHLVPSGDAEGFCWRALDVMTFFMELGLSSFSMALTGYSVFKAIEKAEKE